MTIPEEIELLKIKLGQATDERQQAEVLVELLNKYVSIRSADSQLYIDRLLHLAEKLNEPLYRALGLYTLAVLKRFQSEYSTSLELGRQALSIFGQINEKKGIANSYNNIGVNYELLADYPEAIRNHAASLKIWEELGDKKGIAISYGSIGNVYYEQGNFPEAQKSHFAALKLREEVGDKNGMANSLNNSGNVYYAQGNYSEALKNHLASLKLRKEMGDKHGIGASSLSIGNVYHEQGNYPDALKYYFASLSFSEEMGNKTGMAGSKHNIGNVYLIQGDYSKALINLSASLNIWEEIGDKHGIAGSYSSIGSLYCLQGNYPEALKNYLHALDVCKETDDKRKLTVVYCGIGELYYAQGNFTESLNEHLRALRIAEEIGLKKAIKSSAFSLINTYKTTKDFENALRYYEKYHEVEKQMLGEESTKQMNNLSFMHNLEQKEKDLEIEHLRNVELKKERDRSESLLLNILPAEVAEELKDKGTADARHFDEVTVLFTDFKGFTTVSERLTPQQLVDELHACFSAFDGIMHKHGIEKIKTVGDAYLAVCGLPMPDDAHAENIIKAAIDIRDFMLSRRKELGEMTFEIRIGVHTGSVVAGIVGVKKFAYDIWGDTVNTAARMEQNSEAGKINISQTTYELIKDNFNCIYRGEIEAKNKGKLKMYFVD